MYFEWESHKMHYEIIGEGKPILLIHGLGADMLLMKACMEPIFRDRPGYRRIYVDLPGMGKSDADFTRASSDGVLEILSSFVKDKIEEDFLVVGQSFGGYLARGLLHNFPKKVCGMALIAPVAIARHKDRHLPVTDVKKIDEEFLKELSPQMQADMKESFVRIDRETYRLSQEIMNSFGAANPEFIEEVVKNYTFTFDLDSGIKKLAYSKPVLFLTGKQDTITGYEDVWEIAKDYARATFAVLDIAGHALQIDQNEVFESLIKNWLMRVEQESAGELYGHS